MSTTTRRRTTAALLSTALALSAGAVLTTQAANAAPAHVANPFVGATWYVNQYWSDNVQAAAQRAGGTLGSQMQAIANEPTFVWMDRIGAIGGNVDGPGLEWHLDAALAQQQGTTPILFGLVIYNLPGRDCFALASNGELPATDAGMQRYQNDYIDPIVDLLADPKYENIRVAAVIEPDSLPNMVTNLDYPACAQSAPYYRNGIKYTLDELYHLPNVYTYVDAAHSGWIGWDDNLAGSVQIFTELARSTQAGFASIDGFVTNTANTTPLTEPFLTNPNGTIGGGGNPIRSSSYYEWNPYFDEATFTAAFRQRLISNGFPSSLGMLVDTSRNGWGGPNRPTAVSTSTTLDTYVNESRVDRRTHRGAWCNPLGAGIGERPRATPSAHSHLQAYVWVKPPGESDGSSSEIPNDEGKSFDRMCDPTFNSDKLGGLPTGATPNAPVSGKWFEEQFRTLVTNAYPAITGGGTTPPPTTPPPTTPPPTTPPPTTPPPTTPPPGDTTPPTAPGTPTVSNITATSATISWAASTDNVGVTGYTVQTAAGVTLATSTTTSVSLTGLAADSSYSVRVVARDAAGNVSTPSATATFRTSGGTTPGGACAAQLTIVNSWPNGYQADVRVTASQAISGWSTTVTLPAGGSISNLWSGQNTGTSGAVTVTNAPWNGSLGTGASTSFGFIGNGTAPTAGALTCTAS